MKFSGRLVTLGTLCAVSVNVGSLLSEQSADLVSAARSSGSEGEEPNSGAELPDASVVQPSLDPFPEESFTLSAPPEQTPVDLGTAVQELPNGAVDNTTGEDIFGESIHASSDSIPPEEDGGVARESIDYEFANESGPEAYEGVEISPLDERPEVEETRTQLEEASRVESGLNRLDDRAEVEETQRLLEEGSRAESGLNRLDGLNFGEGQLSVEANEEKETRKDSPAAKSWPRSRVAGKSTDVSSNGYVRAGGLPSNVFPSLVFDHNPLVPLLALPEPPRLRGAKAAIIGAVLMLLAVWMEFEAEESTSKGPANLLAKAIDADVESVATLGSGAAAVAALLMLLTAAQRHVTSVYELNKWAKGAGRGLNAAWRIHHNQLNAASRSVSEREVSKLGAHGDTEQAIDAADNHQTTNLEEENE